MDLFKGRYHKIEKCIIPKLLHFYKGTISNSNPGATRMARGGIRLVHGLTKSTLIMYFSGMKIDPKYAFLYAFCLIFLSCPFQNLSISPKIHPFFPILHVFAPLNDVRAYIAWSWKTTLITWIFGRAWYPLDIRVPSPQFKSNGFLLHLLYEPIHHVHIASVSAQNDDSVRNYVMDAFTWSLCVCAGTFFLVCPRNRSARLKVQVSFNKMSVKCELTSSSTWLL